MPGKPRITLYYDVVSPFARFAYKVLKRYETAWNIDLVLEPRWLGAVMIASGNKPPAELPNRGKYMHEQDIPLASEYWGVSHTAPAVFPFSTLQAMRFLRVVARNEDQAVLGAVTEAIWDGVYAFSGDIASFPAMITPSTLSRAKAAQYLAASKEEANKTALRAEAEALVKEGAFGFPWIVVEREDGERHTFFGSDRFELIAYFLGRRWDGPFPRADGEAGQVGAKL